nr:TIGR02391 family protein [Methylacidiphilum caldifontis]
MTNTPRIRLAAIKIADALKWSTSINEIERIAYGTFPFGRKTIYSEGITSIRAQRVFEWIMTLFQQPYSYKDKLSYLHTFLTGLVPKEMQEEINTILRDCGISLSLQKTHESEFDSRNYHETVKKHSRDLFLKGDYFHAVFEAAKAYNTEVKTKAGLTNLDGQALMNKAFSSNEPLIKLTPCQNETEKNIQDGYRSIAAD